MKSNNRTLMIVCVALLTGVVVLLTTILGVAIFNGGSLSFNNKNQIVFDESFAAFDIKKISVYSSFGNVNIKNSSSDKIRITTNDGNAEYFSAVSEDGVITVENKANRRGRVKLNSLFGRRSVPSDIDIYIPANCVEAIEINSDFGNVELDSIDNISLRVDCACGNIEADYLGGDFDLNTDMGNIEIDRINITKNSSASSSMGNIEIESTNEIKIDYETSMGDCDVKNNNPSASITLKAKTSMGDVEIG